MLPAAASTPTFASILRSLSFGTPRRRASLMITRLMAAAPKSPTPGIRPSTESAPNEMPVPGMRSAVYRHHRASARQLGRCAEIHLTGAGAGGGVQALHQGEAGIHAQEHGRVPALCQRDHSRRSVPDQKGSRAHPPGHGYPCRRRRGLDRCRQDVAGRPAASLHHALGVDAVLLGLRTRRRRCAQEAPPESR